ncbi:MAG TPA: ABC transporter permease, partial [Acidovorax sp.]
MTTTSSTADLGAFGSSAPPATHRYERALAAPAAAVVPTAPIPAAPPPRTRNGTWNRRFVQRARSAPLSLWLAWGV